MNHIHAIAFAVQRESPEQIIDIQRVRRELECIAGDGASGPVMPSNRQIFLTQILIVQHLFGGAVENNLSHVQNDGPIRKM